MRPAQAPAATLPRPQGSWLQHRGMGISHGHAHCGVTHQRPLTGVGLDWMLGEVPQVCAGVGLGREGEQVRCGNPEIGVRWFPHLGGGEANKGPISHPRRGISSHIRGWGGRVLRSSSCVPKGGGNSRGERKPVFSISWGAPPPATHRSWCSTAPCRAPPAQLESPLPAHTNISPVRTRSPRGRGDPGGGAVSIGPTHCTRLL